MTGSGYKLYLDFCELPKKSIDKINIRCTLTAEKGKRLFRFEAIAEKLESGINMQNRYL